MLTTPLWIGGIGSAVGGLGAAAGAYFAFRAASRSSEAAALARDAIAIAATPSVYAAVDQKGGLGHPVTTRTWVWGQRGNRPATDVRIQFTTATGKSGAASIELLEPNYFTNTPPNSPTAPPLLAADIAVPDENWPPPEGDLVDVTVFFSDERGVASYRCSTVAEVRRSDVHPEMVDVRYTKYPTTERVL